MKVGPRVYLSSFLHFCRCPLNHCIWCGSPSAASRNSALIHLAASTPTGAFCGLTFRIPLLIPASSAPRYRKTAEPHISRSQKGEIAGKRPVFRGLKIAIHTFYGRSSGRDPKMTGSGKVAVRVHSPYSQCLHWPASYRLSRKPFRARLLWQTSL